jgi:hypothetical protein
VCGAADDIDTAFVPSRVEPDHRDDRIDRCRRCGATTVDYAEMRVRTERAPWPTPAPGPIGADGTTWDGREGLPGGWWRLPCEVGLRVRTLLRAPIGAVEGLMLSTDLHDGFDQSGPAFVDLKTLTAWDTGRDVASRGRAMFEALDGRFPGRFRTVLDLDRPGTVYLALPLLALTDEVTDAILDQYRAQPESQAGGRADGRAGGMAEHDCVAADTLVFVAVYGAPGTGTAWDCTACGRAWSRIGDTFTPAESGAHILTLDDVE